ncbi:MAG: PilZ domain-containing protein [Candidatus Eremiobacteraeota bacterium]|nr:PilZ domain-containing protein [Candidatus Eremiobacteraeota bacterium]MBV8365350.1 PilZ domain-containing protein [Candidatus Eremiobacteraeota bacterium]
MSEPVRLRFPNGYEQPAILQDVSTGGAALRTHQPMQIGDHLGVSMYLGVRQRYELHARVVYAKPGEQGFHARYGVQFVAMSADERAQLDDFVNERIEASQFGIRAFAPANVQ